MQPLSRREFLMTSSALLAGLTVLPLRGITAKELGQSGAVFLPPALDPEKLQDLAQVAVDAARLAGAQYADIRIGDKQSIVLSMGAISNDLDTFQVNSSRSFGVRVLVDGTWGFAFGVTLEPGQVAQIAREAVIHARRQSAVQSMSGISRVELAQVPVIKGEWETPMKIDPFTVPLAIQIEQLGAYNIAMSRVIGIDPVFSKSSLTWIAETRIFASSEGTLLRQRTMRALPTIVPVCNGFGLGLPNFGMASGGFELILDPTLVDRVKVLADDVVRWASFPQVSFNTGRYPVITEGYATTTQIHTIATACELDRVLGFEGDTVGTSFLNPAEDILAGTIPQFSSQISLNVTPDYTASTWVQWDDEGVAVKPYPLIADGRVVNYVTTRETATSLVATAAGASALSLQGGLSAAEPYQLPMTVATNQTLAPNNQNITLDGLIQEVSDGLLFLSTSADANSSLSNVMAGGVCFVVRKGRVVGRNDQMKMMYRTQRFWKDSLVSLGDASTMRKRTIYQMKGMPWQSYSQVMAAPAALFKDVDIVLG